MGALTIPAASRFYFHASGAIATPTNPAFDAGWEQTGQAVRLPMDRKPQQGPQTALANSATITVPITTTQQILCHQFVSNEVFLPVRLDASVTFSMVMRTIESSASANAFLAYVLRAVSVDGGTFLGTLASSMTNAGTEYGTAAATRIFSAIVLTATTLSEPWRLVIDLGAHAQAPAAGASYTHRPGTSAASDFALTSGLTTDLNPWLELSADLRATPINNAQSFRAASGISTSMGGFR